MAEWFFHVRHSAKPETIKEFLLLLADHDNATLEDLITLGAMRGYTIGTTAKSPQSIKENPAQVARDLGLVEIEHYALTEVGKNVVSLLSKKPEIADEFLHFLHYTLWSDQHPEKDCFSWTYRNLCNLLWDAGMLQVDRVQLADQLANLARTQFQIEGIALSERSAEAVLKWLNELDPPLITEQKIGKQKIKVFSRRAFCSPEIFILAVDYIYRQNGIEYQTNMLLEPIKQEEICKICLLDPIGFENALEWACGQYDFLSQGSSGGWGRYLVLSMPPSLTDFMG